jgi:hypothetical protein
MEGSMMRARKIVRPAMLLAMGLLLSAAAAVPAGAQGVTDGVCSDARKKDGEPQTVPLKDYTVALVSNTIKRDGNNRVVAKATMLFNAGLKRGIYPVVNDQDDIWFQCQSPILPETMRSMRDVSMETPGPGEADELVARLRALADPGIVLKAKDASSWPTFIVFAKNSFQSPGNFGGAMPILEPLFKRYKGIHQQPAFLIGIPFPVTVTTSFAQWSYMPPSGAASDGSAAGQGGNSQQQAAGPQQGPAQQQGTSRPQQGQKQQAPSRGAPLPPPQQPVQGVFAGPPPSVRKSAVDVTISFRSFPDQWQKLLNPARLRNDPGLFETFGYCSDLTVVDSATYKMPCELRPDGKVPLRIRGFKELLISSNGPPLDELLKVAGFSYPYPSSWSRPQTDLVNVDGGNLRDVLARRIPLPQGIPGCQTEIAVSLDNIVSGALTPFPAEPCKKYDIIFRQVQLSPNASVLRGCAVASPDQAVAIRDNQVTCWAPAGQTAPAALSVQLFDGFTPVPLNIARNDVEAQFNFESLAAFLQPLWPYASGIVDLREAPAYEARSVQYVADGGAPCGQPVALANAAGPLPTLKAAGCGQVPRGMTISLQQNGAAQTASGPPPEAFKPSHDDTIEFASLPQGRTVPADQLKRQLPVQFSAEDARTFDAQFGTGAGNSPTFAGVFLFQGNCTSKREAVKFVPFNGAPTPAAYKWPIKAAVFDSSEDPLTLCTTATVGGVQSGAPYLTFALRGARATGPRRAIVISMSPNVATRGGSKVVQESLRAFVDQIGGEVAKGGRLSPINVFQVNGAGEFKQLFTGEAAAQDQNAVKQLISQSQENVAPVTPDFRQLRLIPELKKDSMQNFDRVVFVMDGSDAAQDNMDVLAGLANQFKNPDSIQLLMIGNCSPWLQQNQNIKCTQLPSDASQRPDILVKAFATFINRADAQTMDPQAELRSSVQPPPQPPAPEPQGGARAPAPQPRKH